ncbi:cupin domain-containing protein [Paracoccus onubensis]|uniref:cupin domain-containing protein n=1 Tax=Paracoccus onubensis TaxID=1675788 RepID=UPI0027311806|nr:cupin domain-containing protein [Paracoccus onubensis]MDP0929673.1 cupin domain-containing protein [Paracoccus onubensis]
MTDTKAAILHPGKLPVNDRGNGAATIPLVTRKCGARSMINGITSFQPGARIGLHFHNCEESVMILEGRAIAEIGDDRHYLQAGDTTWIPAGVPHRFLNESDEVMRIFWTYADIEASRTMLATGVEQSIDEEHEKARRL